MSILRTRRAARLALALAAGAFGIVAFGAQVPRADITDDPATTTTVSCTPNPVPVGSPTVCTATVSNVAQSGAPTGSVTFTVAGGSGSFSPSNTCTLSQTGPTQSKCPVTYTPNTVGVHTITASYPGGRSTTNAQLFPSSGGTAVTARLRTTSTIVTCAPSTVAVDDSTICTATVRDTDSGTASTPTGTVAFTSSGVGTFSAATGSTFVPPSSCTLSGSGSSASCSVSYTPEAVGTGSHTITATYSGDTKHATSNGSTTVGVGKRSTSTSVSCMPSTVPVDGSTVCTATVSDTGPGRASTPTGTVTFTSDRVGTFSAAAGSMFVPPNSCTLSGSGSSASCAVTYTPTAISPTPPDTHTITASYSGDAKHATSSASTTVTVTNRTTGTSVTCTAAEFQAGGSITCTAAVSDTDSGKKSTPGGTVTWSSTPSSSAFAPNPCPLVSTNLADLTAPSSCSVTFSETKAGTYTITAAYGGDLKHAVSSGTVSVTVKPGPPATLILGPSPGHSNVNQVDTLHCETATVTDAFGNPTPDITVRFSVTGVNSAIGPAVSGSDLTDEHGQVEFCYTGRLFGPDLITAYADTNNDNVNFPTCVTPEPCGADEKTWTLPLSSLFCDVKITDGGFIIALNTDKASFGGNAKSDNGVLSGSQLYQDHGPMQPMTVKSINVMAVVCNSSFTSASIFGQATIDGSGSFNYRILVQDLNKTNPLLSDTYGILLPGYYSGEQQLGGGSITIH